MIFKFIYGYQVNFSFPFFCPNFTANSRKPLLHYKHFNTKIRITRGE